jgi:ketosteroid isomerase-like protein
VSNFAQTPQPVSQQSTVSDRGAAAVCRSLAAWNAYDGPIGYEVRDFEVGTAGDVAFCHFLKRFTGTMTSGTKVDMRVRATVGLRRITGQWVIVHEHVSEPLQPE